jgi:hypothetical protein
MHNTGVITKEKFSCLWNCVYAAVDNRSGLRKVPSPCPGNHQLDQLFLVAYVRQSIAEEAQSSSSLI